MSLNKTSNVNQLHIGIFGKRNSGKSTLVNALNGYNLLEVSDVEGSTMDSVYKAIEIEGIGSCVLIDTVGFDDDGYLAINRIEKTKEAMQKTDIALIVCSDEDIEQEIEWAKEFKARKAPIVMVINKIDQITNTDKIRNKIHDALKIEPLKISAISKMGIEKIIEEIIRSIPGDFDVKSVTDELVKEGDLVLLVVSRDYQTTEEQLNPMHINTLKELLDKKCLVLTITEDKYEEALASLVIPPKVIITNRS